MAAFYINMFCLATLCKRQHFLTLQFFFTKKRWRYNDYLGVVWVVYVHVQKLSKQTSVGSHLECSCLSYQTCELASKKYRTHLFTSCFPCYCVTSMAWQIKWPIFYNTCKYDALIYLNFRGTSTVFISPCYIVMVSHIWS